MKKLQLLFIMPIAALVFASCNSNDDGVDAGIEIPGITITDDVDCCSAEEALQVYKFLQTVKIIPELTTEIDGKYNVFAYSATGKLHVGYNDLYFVATKKLTGNYIKYFDVNNITPLMYMVKMDMTHSTPASDGISTFDDSRLAIKHGWVSFLMNTSEAGQWTISYNIEVLGNSATVDKTSITVDKLPEGQSWLKNFKIENDTYYLTLVNPTNWQTGKNTIEAYVSKKGGMGDKAYGLATEVFTIEIDPRMPDMGNHTSPDNTALTLQNDGSYQGTINLTMTGLWRIQIGRAHV